MREPSYIHFDDDDRIRHLQRRSVQFKYSNVGEHVTLFARQWLNYGGRGTRDAYSDPWPTVTLEFHEPIPEADKEEIEQTMLALAGIKWGYE